jgi:glycosyltransferase involved in cell wall biosynthesis
MSKISILIPSRNEQYLIPTIDDVLSKASGNHDVEVVVALEGAWPENWDQVVARHGNKVHTIFHGQAKGMRAAINACAASAISRGADFLLKTDAHCSFVSGFDSALVDACGEHDVVVPRRYRLNAPEWKVIEDGRPPIDYEAMAPPDAEKPFQGKEWKERAVERADVSIDTTPTAQGSCWMMRAGYFQFLELMDESTFGSFYNEMQELSLKVWLSGGRVLVVKTAAYSHLHKSKEVGRGYALESGEREKATQGLKQWIDGQGWHRQTLPLSHLKELFPTMPGW